jgi:multidrug/hemolysin transport system permease protein
MITFTKRNLMVFFKDKSSVFFSLLSSFIIIGLYILFLGDVWTNSFDGIDNAREIMDNWIMAGLISVTSLTTTMGAFGTMINDKTTKIQKDFYCSPLKRISLGGGYILSAFIIGIIMSIVTLAFAEIYIVIEGGSLISFAALLKTLLLIVFSTFMNTSMMFFMVSFFSSQNAFATASTILGTLIGFLTGIYLPIGTLPEAVQFVIKIFPPSHSAVLFRQVMMEEAMAEGFLNVPEDIVMGIKKQLGVKFNFGDTIVTKTASVIIVAAVGVLFFTFAVLSISRKKRK